MQMVVQYRMERKMLLKKTRNVLNMYCGQACNNI